MPTLTRQPMLSNPDKVMYPETGFTKRDVLNFYLGISPVLLPHLQNRPITLKRYPNGVNGLFFYERRCPLHRPAWVKTAPVPSTEHAEVHQCVINDAQSLSWIVNLASLELHTLLSTGSDLERPVMLMFDLDPGPPAGLVECAEVAFELKTLFDSLRLQAFLKTSGGKGLHLAVPLNTPVAFAQTKAFSHAIALAIEKDLPRLAVSRQKKSSRTGKVLVDWSQNDRHKSTVAPYSLRARKTPTVSTPITWEELAQFRRSKDAQTMTFGPDAVRRRIARRGDLFKPVLDLKQKLPRLTAKGDFA